MDVALKGVAGQANYIANLLFRQISPRVAHHGRDAAHPQEAFVVLAAEHAETVVAIGDPNKRVVSVQAWRYSGLAARHLDHDEDEAPTYRPGSSASSWETDASRGARDAPVLVDQLLRGPDRKAHADFWKLTETKRCSEPLVGFCPKVASNRGRRSEGQQHIEVRNLYQA